MCFRFALVRLVVLFSLCLPTLLHADPAPFDLPGPEVELRISRAGRELPIAQVPNLQEGDRLWIHPEFPETQSAHYLLVVTFLRGTTNPPPESWFTRIESWNKRVRAEGVVVTVPKGAQQALVFLAPESGGDFGTLRSNVRGKPGAFVRASQDLNRAALDRSRLDDYLQAVKKASDADPEQLKQESPLLARSLAIKLDDDCLKKPLEQQASCLIQNSDQLVLDDTHSQSMVAALANGPSADIAGQMSSTPWAGAGYYSAYVGAVVDVVRLMTTFRNPEYQYIPALALPRGDHLNLQLNTAPSFDKPKSVLVVALPAVEPAKLPPLRAVDAKGVYCVQNSSLVLPVEGAPLVFSTSLAHDFILHVWSKSGASMDLPVKANPARGGFVLSSGGAAKPQPSDFAKLGPEVSGTLRGQWGFESFEGPTFALQTSQAAKWTLVPSDETALIVGRDDTLHLRSDSAVCVDNVIVADEQGKKLKTSYKVASPDELQVDVSLKNATPGPLTMSVKQFGMAKADDVTLRSYAEAGHLDTFNIDAGDHSGVLTGTRLDEVADLKMGEIPFAPAGLTRVNNQDQLEMKAPPSADLTGIPAGSKQNSRVTLKDGRVLDLTATVQPPRPKLTLISKAVQPSSSAASAIQLQGTDELPQNAQLSFALKSQVPESFPQAETIEVATVDESIHTTLSLADGTLTLQDSQTVLAVLDPVKGLGPSAFGPLRFRPVNANGEKGDWQPLVTLVRLPKLQELRCPQAADQQCTLRGSGLFLLDSVATDPQFQQSTPVPDGFAGSTLNVPHPSGQELYVKLRDDRSAVNKVDLPVLPEQ
ncbi:MAG TPA: hypothetical protein VKB58_12340 [Terriglobales bacterium]|jgi:hypothetical protein|nr:hypothetical protein [Terriglobales bacterium]